MKDILGRAIAIGDLAFYNTPGKYKDLSFGEVVGFTPKTVRIQINYGNKRTVNVFPGLIGLAGSKGLLAFTSTVTID